MPPISCHVSRRPIASLRAIWWHGAFEDERDWDTALRAAELHLANDTDESWAYGTLAEHWLLAPLAGKPRDLERARKALDRLKTATNTHAIPATRDQLNRYVSWWTTGNGFSAVAPILRPTLKVSSTT